MEENYNKSEFQTTLQGRVPSEQTLRHIEYATKKFDNVEKSMNELSTDVKLMKQKISTIEQKLDDHIIDQKEHYVRQNQHFEDLGAKMDCFTKAFTEECDNKYASKETELAVKRVTWIVITAVILALLGLVLKGSF